MEGDSELRPAGGNGILSEVIDFRWSDQGTSSWAVAIGNRAREAMIGDGPGRDGCLRVSRVHSEGS